MRRSGADGCSRPRAKNASSPPRPGAAANPAAAAAGAARPPPEARVARGKEAIDARLDLHGLTQAQAHAALLHFLRNALRATRAWCW